MRSKQILTHIIILLLFFTFICNSQNQKTDSIGNFYVIDKELVWQKYYQLDDANELDEHLRSEHLTSNLAILNYTTSAQSNISYIDGNNLPQYTSKGFQAFIIIDIIQDKYRVTVRDITFPDFVQERYYNGRSDNRGGTLSYYILRTSDFEIKRNSGTYNVLETFSNSFDAIFNLNADL